MLQEFAPLCSRCGEQLIDSPDQICGTCADDLRDRASADEAMNEHDEGED